MAISSVTSSKPLIQATPTRQPDPPKQVDRPAERTAAPPPPTTSIASVNTNGQTIGTRINTSA